MSFLPRRFLSIERKNLTKGTDMDADPDADTVPFPVIDEPAPWGLPVNRDTEDLGFDLPVLRRRFRRKK